MSETVESVEAEPDFECKICGHPGGPMQACEMCHGNGGIQPRAFTRSEEIQGAKGDPGRYGRTGNVSPKIISLPGSFNPGGGN